MRSSNNPSIRVGLVAFCLLGSQAASALPPNFQDTIVVGGLASPTSMTFAPDGRIFVLEKAGRVRIVKNGSLLPTPFLTLTVEASSERGLLGIDFDPNFATNRFIYVYYTRATPTIKNRISRFTASATNPDVAQAGSEVVLLDEIPSDAGNHNGGAVHFGPDGKLYAAVGDGGSIHTNAQLLSSLSGKMLRLNSNGSVPTDNPFVGTTGARGEVWAYGLRNPFTFAFDPVGGRMHINDVGQNTWEEIDLGAAGANYGWPTCEGPQNTGVGTCTSTAFTYPIYSYPHSVGFCITGGAFYRGNQFPASYVGSYFFADYVTGFIKQRTPSGQVIDFAPAGTVSSPVDLDVAVDGSLYYISIGPGQVRRIRYLSTSTSPVITSASTATATVGATFSYQITATNSPTSYNAAPLPAGLAINTTTGRISGTPTAAGIFNIALSATNSTGTGTLTLTLTVNAASSPPVATIVSPSAGTHYVGGQTISYSGTGTDPEDGTLPASAFSWTIVFHHNTHTHPFLGPVNGVRNSTFTIPTSGETSANVWYRIHLTVTDSDGVQTTTFRDVLPQTSTFTLVTNPPGLQLTLDGQPFTTPLITLGVVGMDRTLGVVSPQTFGNQTYVFTSWSDGGAATHMIQTPSANTTYTAVYTGRSTCDLSRDGATNVVDVQLMVNQALGITACTADINQDSRCDVIDVQRVVNAALGGPCVSP